MRRILPLIVTTIFVYIPVWANYKLFLERGNDLQEFFWPIYYFSKQSIATYRQLPLWYPHILSGTPLLPDPQAPIFYLPNFIFLLLPLDLAFLVTFFVHTLLGGVGIYLLCKLIFKRSEHASLAAGCLYIATPRLAAFIEAGHVGLIFAFAWLPFVALALGLIIISPSFKRSFFLAIGFIGLLLTHSITFFVALIGAFIVLICSKPRKSAVIFFLVSIILTAGFSATALIPQITWSRNSTRTLLLNDRDVYPKWKSKGEFISAVVAPWQNGIAKTWDLDTEKWLALGIMPMFLASIGFISQSRKTKIIILSTLTICILIALNNSSPIYSWLLGQDWFVISRVATRLWFIPIFITVILCGFAWDKIKKGKVIFFALAVFESLALGWIWLSRPFTTTHYVPLEVYDLIAPKADEHYRVFCVTRCLSQKEAVKRNLELVDGYSTLIQKNYNELAWQFTGHYWSNYTLSIPPFGTYLFSKIIPDAKTLGALNTKYIIAPYELANSDLKLIKQINEYFVYENLKLLPRVYTLDNNQVIPLRIQTFSPHSYKVYIKENVDQRLYLSEIYSEGWIAKTNTNKIIPIEETPLHLRSINVPTRVTFIDFYYSPESLHWGIIISSITILILFLLFYRRIIKR